ncbi:MAG: 2,3,4,5-tetrahydropyridine-2,6-dicarboxylate N-succinyltransferase [Chlorobiota bacterium]
MTVEELRAAITRWSNASPDALRAEREAVIHDVRALLDALSRGEVRAASPQPDGSWQVHSWVKQGILLCFRVGQLSPMRLGGWHFTDIDLLPPRWFAPEDRVRLVPGGSTVRTGAYVAPTVICMPPMYINVGAYVDEGTMVDSHALIGSCAQIGKRVHVSAGAQIGGVLEPPTARPVIVEDEVLIGANCGLFEGVLVCRRAVLAAGVQLTATTPVYDLVHERLLTGTPESPIEIPEAAVVVPGVRGISTEFARAHRLGIVTPLIVKYRDRQTDARTALEEALRAMFR